MQTIGYNCTEEMYKEYNKINSGMWELFHEYQRYILEEYQKSKK